MKIEMNFHALYDAIDPFKNKISFLHQIADTFNSEGREIHF